MKKFGLEGQLLDKLSASAATALPFRRWWTILCNVLPMGTFTSHEYQQHVHVCG
jgi:predicted secreted protein